MIVTVNLYPEVSKRMQAKIKLEQRVVTHLKPIIGEVETLVLLDNMTTHINNLFQQEFSSISNVLYSRDIYDYQEVIDGSDAIILFSDSLVNKRNSYYSFFHLLQNNQKISAACLPPDIPAPLWKFRREEALRIPSDMPVHRSVQS